MDWPRRAAETCLDREQLADHPCDLGSPAVVAPDPERDQSITRFLDCWNAGKWETSLGRASLEYEFLDDCAVTLRSFAYIMSDPFYSVMLVAVFLFAR